MMEKLLILDDEALILTSLKHLFENDYETFQTTDAEAALRLAEEHDLAVILCDERMPGISGHEFLRRVKEFSRATRVVMSGYADMSALTDAVNGGQIFAYIAKPWEPLTLKAQVSAAVAHFKLVQEVEHERELLRALMENIPDPIYFKERESRAKSWDQRFRRVHREKRCGLLQIRRRPAVALARGRDRKDRPAPARSNRAAEQRSRRAALVFDNQGPDVRPERAGFRDRRHRQGFYGA
jgi:response regulator RpfG family c-di-GMP phosphodiesterase